MFGMFEFPGSPDTTATKKQLKGFSFLFYKFYDLDFNTAKKKYQPLFTIELQKFH